MDIKQYLDFEGLNIVISEVLERIDKNNNVVSYSSLAAFPTVGSENTIYIDQSQNDIYRWDDENIKYYRIGTDYENIEIINGGNSYN